MSDRYKDRPDLQKAVKMLQDSGVKVHTDLNHLREDQILEDKYIVLWEDAELGRMRMSFSMRFEKAKDFQSKNNYDAVLVKVVAEKQRLTNKETG